MVRGACICHRGAGDVRQEVLGRMRGCGLREEGSKARGTGVMGVGTGRIVMTGQACQQTTQGSGCSLRPHQREDKATDHCDDTSRRYCSRMLCLAPQCAAEQVFFDSDMLNNQPRQCKSKYTTRSQLWSSLGIFLLKLHTHATLVHKSFSIAQNASESLRNNHPRCLSARYMELETP